MYKVKTCTRYLLEKKKMKVSYINYIMNKGVVLYSGNSLQTMHSLVGGGGGGGGADVTMGTAPGTAPATS